MSIETSSLSEIESTSGEKTSIEPDVEANISSAMMEIQRVDGEVWDGHMSGFDGAAQEQMYAFTKGRWPNVKCEPNLFYLQGKLVGGAMVMIQPLPLGIGNIAVVKWGPMLADNLCVNGQKIYAKIVEMLIREYADERKMMISILPKATPSPDNLPLQHLIQRGFKSGAQLGFPDRYIVNLRLADEEMRKSFAQKWRYHLNRSMKNNLVFERAEAAQFDEFDRLYKIMNERKNFADHSAYNTIIDLMELKDKALRPELFFVRHEQEIVAGGIIHKTGDTAVYLYGATNGEALPLRAGYFLHWEIIRWLRDNTNALWYDLGGTDGFQGLHQFKKGMVGTSGHIEPVPPVMNYASDLKAQVAGNLAFFARDRLQQVRTAIEKIRVDLATPDQKKK